MSIYHSVYDALKPIMPYGAVCRALTHDGTEWIMRWLDDVGKDTAIVKYKGQALHVVVYVNQPLAQDMTARLARAMGFRVVSTSTQIGSVLFYIDAQRLRLMPQDCFRDLCTLFLFVRNKTPYDYPNAHVYEIDPE